MFFSFEFLNFSFLYQLVNFLILTILLILIFFYSPVFSKKTRSNSSGLSNQPEPEPDDKDWWKRQAKKAVLFTLAVFTGLIAISYFFSGSPPPSPSPNNESFVLAKAVIDYQTSGKMVTAASMKEANIVAFIGVMLVAAANGIAAEAAANGIAAEAAANGIAATAEAAAVAMSTEEIKEFLNPAFVKELAYYSEEEKLNYFFIYFYYKDLPDFTKIYPIFNSFLLELRQTHSNQVVEKILEPAKLAFLQSHDFLKFDTIVLTKSMVLWEFLEICQYVNDDTTKIALRNTALPFFEKVIALQLQTASSSGDFEENDVHNLMVLFNSILDTVNTLLS